jgi:hypothetical protein
VLPDPEPYVDARGVAVTWPSVGGGFLLLQQFAMRGRALGLLDGRRLEERLEPLVDLLDLGGHRIRTPLEKQSRLGKVVGGPAVDRRQVACTVVARDAVIDLAGPSPSSPTPLRGLVAEKGRALPRCVAL